MQNVWESKRKCVRLKNTVIYDVKLRGLLRNMPNFRRDTLAPSSSLRMQVTLSSETSVNFYNITCRQIFIVHTKVASRPAHFRSQTVNKLFGSHSFIKEDNIKVGIKLGWRGKR